MAAAWLRWALPATVVLLALAACVPRATTIGDDFFDDPNNVNPARFRRDASGPRHDSSDDTVNHSSIPPPLSAPAADITRSGWLLVALGTACVAAMLFGVLRAGRQARAGAGCGPEKQDALALLRECQQLRGAGQPVHGSTPPTSPAPGLDVALLSTAEGLCHRLEMTLGADSAAVGPDLARQLEEELQCLRHARHECALPLISRQLLASSSTYAAAEGEHAEDAAGPAEESVVAADDHDLPAGVDMNMLLRQLKDKQLQDSCTQQWVEAESRAAHRAHLAKLAASACTRTDLIAILDYAEEHSLSHEGPARTACASLSHSQQNGSALAIAGPGPGLSTNGAGSGACVTSATPSGPSAHQQPQHQQQQQQQQTVGHEAIPRIMDALSNVTDGALDGAGLADKSVDVWRDVNREHLHHHYSRIRSLEEFQRTTKERRRRDAQLAHDREIAQKKMLRLAEQKLEDDRRRFSALAEQLMHREKNAYIKDLTEQGRQQRVDDVAQVQLAAWLQAGAVATVFAVAILQHLMRERTGGCPTPDLTSLPSWLSFLPVASFVSFTTGAFCSVVQIFTGTWHLLCGLVVLLVYLLLAYVHQQKFGLVVMGLSALYFQRPLVASLLLQSWPLGFVAAANLLWAFALQMDVSHQVKVAKDAVAEQGLGAPQARRIFQWRCCGSDLRGPLVGFVIPLVLTLSSAYIAGRAAADGDWLWFWPSQSA